jgi:diaminopimelate decarboxylase
VNVLIRVNPGVEAHTHHFIQTARTDSKFGFSIADGSAREMIDRLTACGDVNLLGINSHIGSQIFDDKPYKLVISKLTDFIGSLGVTVRELDLGGGFGILYTDADKPIKPADFIATIVGELNASLNAKNLPRPRIIIEPGRSIVAEAGITLYTVGAVKEIKDVKKYVNIDGGMFDNPRYALYQAKYTAVFANRARDAGEEVVTVAGKCCESGDMIIDGIELPRAARGDILAVFSTGAYNYSMASHYNRNFVPPMVLVKDGKSGYIVKPESYEDIIRHDAVPDWI